MSTFRLSMSGKLTITTTEGNEAPTVREIDLEDFSMDLPLPDEFLETFGVPVTPEEMDADDDEDDSSWKVVPLIPRGLLDDEFVNVTDPLTGRTHLVNLTAARAKKTVDLSLIEAEALANSGHPAG